MSQEDRTAAWREVGEITTLTQRKCHRVYAKAGKRHDLALFYYHDKFYAMEAWCSHMGGPLYEGEIEDYKGKGNIMCPWHGYMFDLEDGTNEIGIKQETFEVKVEDRKVYIYHRSELSTIPYQ